MSRLYALRVGAEGLVAGQTTFIEIDDGDDELDLIAKVATSVHACAPNSELNPGVARLLRAPPGIALADAHRLAEEAKAKGMSTTEAEILFKDWKLVSAMVYVGGRAPRRGSGMTPERALQALDGMEEHVRPWPGMRRASASSIEMACTKCSSLQSVDVNVGDEPLHGFMLAFMKEHRHEASA